jgi:hypothetical protein
MTEGYDRKYKEALRYTLYGIGFYIGLYLLRFLFILLHVCPNYELKKPN